MKSTNVLYMYIPFQNGAISIILYLSKYIYIYIYPRTMREKKGNHGKIYQRWYHEILLVKEKIEILSRKDKLWPEREDHDSHMHGAIELGPFPL